MDAFLIAKQTPTALVFLAPAGSVGNWYSPSAWTRDPQRALLWLDEHLADLEVVNYPGSTVMPQGLAISVAHS